MGMLTKNELISLQTWQCLNILSVVYVKYQLLQYLLCRPLRNFFFFLGVAHAEKEKEIHVRYLYHFCKGYIFLYVIPPSNRKEFLSPFLFRSPHADMIMVIRIHQRNRIYTVISLSYCGFFFFFFFASTQQQRKQGS